MPFGGVIEVGVLEPTDVVVELFFEMCAAEIDVLLGVSAAIPDAARLVN